MRPNVQFPADLVTFTKEILDGKLHFCAVPDPELVSAQKQKLYNLSHTFNSMSGGLFGKGRIILEGT